MPVFNYHFVHYIHKYSSSKCSTRSKLVCTTLDVISVIYTVKYPPFIIIFTPVQIIFTRDKLVFPPILAFLGLFAHPTRLVLRHRDLS